MLERIKENISGLVALYEKEKARVDELSGILSELRSENEALRRQNIELNGQIDNLRLTGAFSVETDRYDSKERLDELITEIDKCIRLLEK